MVPALPPITARTRPNISALDALRETRRKERKVAQSYMPLDFIREVMDQKVAVELGESEGDVRRKSVHHVNAKEKSKSELHPCFT